MKQFVITAFLMSVVLAISFFVVAIVFGGQTDLLLLAQLGFLLVAITLGVPGYCYFYRFGLKKLKPIVIPTKPKEKSKSTHEQER